MAFPGAEALQQFQFIHPAQRTVVESVTAQMNRMLRLNTIARIAPEAGAAPAGGLIDAGLGQSLDIQA